MRVEHWVRLFLPPLLLLAVLAGAWWSVYRPAQPAYLEVWFDCPGGIAIVRWAEAGYPPSASDEQEVCRKLEEGWRAEHGDETQE